MIFTYTIKNNTPTFIFTLKIKINKTYYIKFLKNITQPKTTILHNIKLLKTKTT